MSHGIHIQINEAQPSAGGGTAGFKSGILIGALQLPSSWVNKRGKLSNRKLGL